MAECRCGQTLKVGAGRAIYCSHACYVAHQRERAAESLIARFWAFVNKDTPSGCWLWTGGTIRGYGQFHLPRTHGTHHTVYAHRFAWTITNGPIADKLFVCHGCDTPRCVNPNHLFLGTQRDNLADARAKGRLVDGRHLIKVSDAGLVDIRTRYRPRQNGKELAQQYGVTLISILRIVAGTQRVRDRHVAQAPANVVFERVPSVQLPVVGEVR